MNKTTKLKVGFDNLQVKVQVQDLDPELLPLLRRLLEDGDQFGPVAGVYYNICVTLSYADRRRGPVEPKVFGRTWETIQALQQGTKP